MFGDHILIVIVKLASAGMHEKYSQNPLKTH